MTSLRQFSLAAVAAISLTVPAVAQADNCGPDCGKVTAIHTVKHEGQGTGLGAVAGGVAGGLLGHQIGRGTGNTVATIGGAAGGAYVGHQVEKKVRSETVHQVDVAMDGGQRRHFDYKDSPPFAVGDRVRISNGKLERYPGR